MQKKQNNIEPNEFSELYEIDGKRKRWSELSNQFLSVKYAPNESGRLIAGQVSIQMYINDCAAVLIADSVLSSNTHDHDENDQKGKKFEEQAPIEHIR